MSTIILFVLLFFLPYFSFSQPQPITDLVAISGLDTLKEGSIRLFWRSPGPDSLPEGSTYYIQYSTFSKKTWDLAESQIQISTGNVLPNEEQSVDISLTSFIKSNNLAKDTTFYFVIFVSSPTELPVVSNVATGWITLWQPYAELVYAEVGEHEGEILLQFQGSDDYINNTMYNALDGYWHIHYTNDPNFVDWSTSTAQIRISTHTFPSYQWYAGCLVTGLVGGVTYYFRMWAEDDLCNLSVISNKTTCWAQIDYSAPRQITSIRVSCGFKHINLVWSFPYEDSYSDGFIYNSSTYTGNYEIRYRNDQQITNETLWNSATRSYYIDGIEIIPLTSTTTVITGLTNALQYYISIKIADEKGNWSLISSSSPFIEPINSPPQCLYPNKHFIYDPLAMSTTTVISSTTVILDWQQAIWYPGVSQSDNSFDEVYGDYISSYTLKLSTYLISGNIGTPIIEIHGISFSSQTIHNLLEDTTYWWCLTVYDSEGVSSTTVLFKFVINSKNSPPQFPTNPLISPTTVWHTKTDQIVFDFKDAYDFDPFDYIVGYKIFVSTSEDFSGNLVEIPQTGLLTTSYFLVTSSSSPSIEEFKQFENKRCYWYAVAYDSGAPFGYVQLSTQTPVSSFWLNTIDSPPAQFDVYFPSGTKTQIGSDIFYKVVLEGTTYYAIKEVVVDNTTYYVAKSTPIILAWQPTFDPDPEDGIYEYAVFISSWREPYAQGEVGWRYVEKKDELGDYLYPPYPPNEWFIPSTIFLSTSIVNLVEPGTGSQPPLELVENATYFWRVRARDGWNPNPFSGWIWYDEETFSPPLEQPPAMFFVDFTSEPPTGYDIIKPTGVVNPPSLQGPILFKWTQPFDPDPFDHIKHYFLNISTVMPNSSDGWYTLNAPLWKVNIYLDNPKITSTTVLFTNPTLSPGSTYFWQLHCWSENEWRYAVTPSTSQPWYVKPYGVSKTTGAFFVSNQKPYKFALLSPGVPTTDPVYTHIKTYRPTFYWEQVYDPDNYDPIVSSYVVVISSISNFSVKYEIYTSTTYLPLEFDLKSKITYYWYVKAYDKFDNWQTPYSTFSFVISNFAPNSFELLYPIQEEVVTTNTPIFMFQNNSDPDGDILYYTIYYSTSADFSVDISSGEWSNKGLQKGATVSINSPWTFEENKKYYWRVVADDRFGSTSTTSICSFWINTFEEPPHSFDIKVTSGIITTSSITFSWYPTYDNDPKDYVNYKICISSMPGYVVGVSTYIIISDSNTTNYTFNLTQLTENAQYCWWVEAYDSKGNFTKSDSSYIFIVDLINEPPDDVYLVTPGSTYSFVRISQPVKLEWNAANKTEWWKNINYKLYLAEIEAASYTSIDLSSGPFKNYFEVANFSYSTSALKENTTYFWYVVALNPYGEKTSEVKYFFVDSQNDLPQQFELLEPKGTIQTRKPTFIWQKVTDLDDNITKYEIKYSLSSNFSVNVTTTITVSASISSYTVDSKLSMSTTYYWKVRVYDERGLWTESQTESFYIPYFKPEKVTIIQPLGAIDTRQPELMWLPAVHPEINSYVKEYKLELYEKLTNNKLIDVITSTNSYKITQNLIQNLSYYFVVTAIDEEGVYGEPQTAEFFVLPKFIPDKVKKLSYEIQNYKFILYWPAVTTYTDGNLADDIKGYNIYRSKDYETLLTANTVYQFVPSSITMFTDYIYWNTYYYLIKTVTFGGIESESSDIVSSYNFGSKIITSKNLKIVIPKEVDEEISISNYKICITTQEISETELTQLNIISKLKVEVVKDNYIFPYKFSKPITLELELPMLNFAMKSVQSEINFKPTLFFFNNIENIFINTDYDLQSNKITASISNTGIYFVRLVAPPNDVSIVNIYPKKIFTPKSNQENKIHFVIYNPTAYQIEGEIYDMDLRYVAKLKLENNELVWDGKYENGEYVKKGVYIYKIKVGEKIFTGTVIVAK